MAAGIIRTRATPMSSSSAATWDSAVSTPCPSSTFPGRTSTTPERGQRRRSPRRGYTAAEAGSATAGVAGFTPRPPEFGRSREHGADDAGVRAPQAQVAVQGGAHLRIGRIVAAPEQFHRRDEGHRHAVAALGEPAPR